MPLQPRCLHGSRQPSQRTRQIAPPPSPPPPTRPAPPVRHDAGVRSVLGIPHRRRAALVAALAMLLTIWLRQVAVASPSDQQRVLPPLTHGVSVEDWLE